MKQLTLKYKEHRQQMDKIKTSDSPRTKIVNTSSRSVPFCCTFHLILHIEHKKTILRCKALICIVEKSFIQYMNSYKYVRVCWMTEW